jgi:hypothetical protein
LPGILRFFGGNVGWASGTTSISDNTAFIGRVGITYRLGSGPVVAKY